MKRCSYDVDGAIRRLMNNQDIYRHLVGMFISALDCKWAQSRALVETGDTHTLQREMHQLKGGARAIGAVTIAEELHKLETIASQADEAGGAEQLRSAWSELDALLIREQANLQSLRRHKDDHGR